MGEVLAALSLLCLAGIIVLAVLSVCRFVGFWTWTATWISSSKEEKMNLTKGKGIFNANGYFVSSDSLGDINMCYSGSFKRFDPVDHDAMTNLSGSVYPASPQYKIPSYPQEISLPYGTIQSNDISEFTKPAGYPLSTPDSPSLPSGSPAIPPQPLRPAPAPPPSPSPSLTPPTNPFSIPPPPTSPAPTLPIRKQSQTLVTSSKPEDSCPGAKSDSNPFSSSSPVSEDSTSIQKDIFSSSTVVSQNALEKHENSSSSIISYFPVLQDNKEPSIAVPPSSSQSQNLSKSQELSTSSPVPCSPVSSLECSLFPTSPSSLFPVFFAPEDTSLEILPQPSSPAPTLPKVPPRRPPPPVPPRKNLPRRRSSGSSEAEDLPQGVQRAMSCDSVSSDTSVALTDLLEPHVTGHLCIALDYDSDCADLSVGVLEAKDIVGPDEDNQNLMNTYVRVYLLPDKTTYLQTRIYKKSNSPSYQEKFLFGVEPEEFASRCLLFYLYCVDKTGSTLIGEAQFFLSDVTTKHDITTWVTLTDTGQERSWWGEVMLSLSYLPTAERLTVVIVKARNLVFSNRTDSTQSFVKVYLLKHGKKVHKKRTSMKKDDRSPVFNEAMIFNVPATTLHSIQIRVTVAEHTGDTKALSLGHVILGSDASAKPLSHWSQMISSPRKPVSMWHSLRK